MNNRQSRGLNQFQKQKTDEKELNDYVLIYNKPHEMEGISIK